jgi:RND family efflux transporter MFP subunit
MKKKIFIPTLITTALIVAASFKLQSNKLAVEGKVYRNDPEKRVLVKADTVSYENFDKSFSYTGTFAPLREVMLIPQVQGEVTAVYFNEGDVVATGKTLIQIDDELLQTQVIAAEANYEIAKRNLDRYENAAQGGGVSKIQIDNSRLNLKNAESQLKQLKKQISLSRIEAPFNGTITFREVEVGSIAGQTPVARITDLSQLKLEISVPEKEIFLFTEGETADVTTDIYPGKKFAGRIDFVSDRADESHNYQVKILIRNNDASFMLKAGMYGNVFLEKGLREHALVIDRKSLLGSAKNPQVFVVQNHETALRDIQIGNNNGDVVEVLAGLDAGEIIVTSGHINLTQGSKVEIAQ